MWKEVEHVILAPEKVIDEIVDVFLVLFSFIVFLNLIFACMENGKDNKEIESCRLPSFS